RVRRLGTIAMSSKPYARRPDLPIPISTSTVPPALSSSSEFPRISTCSGETETQPDALRERGSDLRARAETDLVGVVGPVAAVQVDIRMREHALGALPPRNDPRVDHPERLAHEHAVQRVALRLHHVGIGRERDPDAPLVERDAQVPVP